MTTLQCLEEFHSASRSLLQLLHLQRPDHPASLNQKNTSTTDPERNGSNSSKSNADNQSESTEAVRYLRVPGVSTRPTLLDNNLNYAIAAMCGLRKFGDINESNLELTMEVAGIRDTQSAIRVMFVRDELLKLKQERGLSTTAAVLKLTDRIKRTVARKQASGANNATAVAKSRKRKQPDDSGEPDASASEPATKRRKTNAKDKSNDKSKSQQDTIEKDSNHFAIPRPPSSSSTNTTSNAPNNAASQSSSSLDSPLMRLQGFFSRLLRGAGGGHLSSSDAASSADEDDSIGNDLNSMRNMWLRLAGPGGRRDSSASDDDDEFRLPDFVLGSPDDVYFGTGASGHDVLSDDVAASKDHDDGSDDDNDKNNDDDDDNGDGGDEGYFQEGSFESYDNYRSEDYVPSSAEDDNSADGTGTNGNNSSQAGSSDSKGLKDDELQPTGSNYRNADSNDSDLDRPERRLINYIDNLSHINSGDGDDEVAIICKRDDDDAAGFIKEDAAVARLEEDGPGDEVDWSQGPLPSQGTIFIDLANP